jgi:predicted nuclease of restriction endonuclease-like (RecB) superfamily
VSGDNRNNASYRGTFISVEQITEEILCKSACTIWKEQIMLINNNEYKETLQETFECIKAAQYSAVVSANHALLHRNWRIGKIITDKSQWGNKFIDILAADIRREFPETTGFSVRNLKYMKKFSGLFTEDDIDQMGFAGLTWYHHIALMDKTADREHYK